MMVKLFLCSYFAAVSSFTPQFVGGDLKGKVLAFIPTASLHEKYTEYVDEAKQAFENMGLKVEVLDVSSAPKELTERTLQRCDLIYVSGGNTFFLLQELEKSGAKTIILEQVKGGKPYIGESAGSVIMAPNISYVKDMDEAERAAPQLKSFEGLGLVDFYPLPHYKSFPFEEVTEKMLVKYAKLGLKPITNQQALFINGDKTTLIEVKQ